MYICVVSNKDRQGKNARELIVQHGQLAMTGLAADGIKQMPGNQATAAASRLIR